MKILLTLLVFISIHLSSLAQNEVFRIDSIPMQGILLDKGWKWHAGDNPDFAKPDFDDSQWGSIDPTQDVMDLKQFGKANIGWFRLTFKVDSSLFRQTFALSVRQVGSSQIYNNGSLVSQIGQFSTITSKAKGYDPSGTPYRFTFGNNPTQTIAVKFEKPNVSLIKHIGYKNNCLRLQIVEVEQITHIVNKYNRHDLIGFALDYFKSGLFLLIAFLHLWLFWADKKNVHNLTFCIWSFAITLLLLFGNYSFYPIEIIERNQISVVLTVAIPALSLLHTYALYKTFGLRLDFYLKLLIILTTLSIISIFVSYDFGWALGMVFMALLSSILIFKISWQAYKKGDKGAKAIAVSELIYIACSTGVFFISERLIDSIDSTLIKNAIFNFGFIIPPIAIVYYFAYYFNINRKNLQNKLTEVQQLSQEKQEALQKQNAELQAALLQGQTIERKRVAADLHDSLGSTMSSLIYTVNAIDTNNLDNDEKNVYLHLKQMLDTAYNEIRLLSHNLLPDEFEKQGLAEALRHFVRKINQTKTIQFDLSIAPQLGRLSPKIEFELYSICLELINNILKHAHATQASIDLTHEKNQVQLTIADNGRGFFDNDSDGKGMKNVKARVESLNGTWHTKNIEGNGVCNEIAVPV